MCLELNSYTVCDITTYVTWSIIALGHLQRLKISNCTGISDLVSKKCRLFQFGDMENKQTSVLGGGNLTVALENLKVMFWIGIVEYFDASICLLSLQLGQYNKEQCSCENRIAKFKASGHIVRAKNMRAGKTNVSIDDLDQISSITLLDAILYKYGVKLFLSRVARGETILGSKILCEGLDDITALY